MIMKFFAFFVVAMATFSVAVANIGTQEEGKKDDGLSGIRVQCQNVEWSILTPTEQRYAATQLEDSFHKIHSQAHGIPKELSHVTYASDPSQMGPLVNLLVGFWWEGNYGYFTGHVAFKQETMTSTEDDATDLALWERELEILLSKGPYSSLARADNCHIVMN